MCVCVCVWAQLCPTLCDPMGCSSLVSSLHRISQARILEWVAIPTPGDLPNPEIEPKAPGSPALQVEFVLLSHWEVPSYQYKYSL